MKCRTPYTESGGRSHAVIDLKAALHAMFERNTEELHWLAEVIVGDTSSAKQCIADAMQHASVASHVAPNWIGLWVKRSVARVAVDETRTEIQCIAESYARQDQVEMHPSSLHDLNVSILRSVPTEQICEKANAFERAALVLHFYLRFSVPDCALLIGCQRSLIVPACVNALQKILQKDSMLAAAQRNHDEHRSSEVAA